MVPWCWARTRSGIDAPRTRGDGPGAHQPPDAISSCSPYARGWSRLLRRHRRPSRVLPAPAGMVPAPRRSRCGRWCVPRTRGDGPWDYPDEYGHCDCSPHLQGWPRGWAAAARYRARSSHLRGPPARRTGAGRPAPLPATRGMVQRSGEGSPPRSPVPASAAMILASWHFPRFSGMAPGCSTPPGSTPPVPRHRGDEPRSVRFRAPPRGDAPPLTGLLGRDAYCSPHLAGTAGSPPYPGRHAGPPPRPPPPPLHPRGDPRSRRPLRR